MKQLFSSIKNTLTPAAERTDRSRRLANRKAIAELRALSDSQLKDIGIDRSSITYSVLNGKPERNQSKKAA